MRTFPLRIIATPVSGSAFIAISGTDRVKMVLTPPPVAPCTLFHVVSTVAESQILLGHTREVPPQAITLGEEAGKSTLRPVPPLLLPSSPEAQQITMPLATAEANRESIDRHKDAAV
jgi:hypothetical protein